MHCPRALFRLVTPLRVSESHSDWHLNNEFKKRYMRLVTLTVPASMLSQQGQAKELLRAPGKRQGQTGLKSDWLFS